jgi:hypothetical protein
MPVIEIEETEQKTTNEKILPYAGKKLIIDDVNELVSVSQLLMAAFDR